ncbi:cytochrome d ubiquinol oxidase subunit II [Nocardiopsis valliformis]|uniref:cytochrome d ubiquinol oxidase subunit II n=1 Tax=Nocardiopsis valliformis TaxID=239974 RepID=UPI00034CF25F|nr:cytochrome d ubiquinol oxidase subunit II [Nocardiopsis valliformis]
MDLLSASSPSAVLLALFVVGYLVLAGSDIGLGMLMPHVARTPAERRRVVAAIAPYFLASEVWLVAALGVMAGLFPVLEHHVIGALWPVLVVLTAGWLFRDAGLWFRGRVDSARWRFTCDTAIVAGSWTLAVCWGLALAGLLGGGAPLNLFTVLGAAAVVSLFALRGAAFGAERLVGPDDAESGAESADAAARATRTLARVALGAVAVTAAVAATGTGSGGAGSGGSDGLVLAEPGVAVLLVTVLLAVLGATSGLTGPMLSRHTSALAIAVPGLLVALCAQLPTADIPGTTGVFVWSMLLPAVPVMLIGQVWLYRMTRRPAASASFFA